MVMGSITKIQWCDHTFNPWRGCTKVHTGCLNCYKEHAAQQRTDETLARLQEPPTP